MPLPSKTSLGIYRGDSAGMQVTLWADEAKTEPADLTGAEVRSQIRATMDSTEVMAEWGVVVEGNVITLNLLPKQTADLEPKAVFDVQVDWSGGEETDVQTVVLGSLSVSPDVTRTAVP